MNRRRASSEDGREAREVGRSPAGSRVPARSSREAVGGRGAAAVRATAGDVVEGTGAGVDGGVDVADCALTRLATLVVDESEDAGNERSRGTRAADESILAVVDNGVLGALSREIREEAASGLVAAARGRGDLGLVGCNDAGLVRGRSEDV